MTAAQPVRRGRARGSVQQLFETLFPSARRPPHDRDLRRSLLDTGIPDQQQALSSRQQGVLTVGEEILREYFRQPAFHPVLADALYEHVPVLLASALAPGGWLERKSHPATELLECLGEFAPGWYPAHPQAQELLSRITGWLAKLGDTDAQSVLDEARQWIRAFEQRTQKIRDRLRAAEEGALRLEYARRHAARVIRRQLAGRPLPGFLARDLREHWWPAMQWILLNKGEGVPLWNQTVKTMTLMFWSLQPEMADGANRDKLQRLSRDLRSSLRELLDELIPQEAVRSRMLDDVQLAHTALLHGRELDFVEVTEPAGASLLDDAGAEVSRDLLAEIAGISLEDWFEVCETGQRMRLLIKQEDCQQLLFVNQAGVKALTTTFEDFAWRLTSREIVAVLRPVPPGELVVERLEALAAMHREKQRHARRGRVPETVDDVTPDHAAASEQPCGVTETSGDDIPEPAAVSEPVDDGERKRARLLVSGLPLGAWLDFHGEGERVRLKLVLVLSSSNKYVFVSRNGLDRREVLRQDLVGGLARGEISVLNNDSRYDDTLNRVVNGLQRKNTEGWTTNGE